MNAPTISHRVWLFALTLILLTGLLLPVAGEVHADTPVINPVLPTTFAWPSWWHQDPLNPGVWPDCDGLWYRDNDGFPNDPENDAVVKTSWRGIQSCGPNPGLDGGRATPNFPNSDYDKDMFQCTELAARYLEVAYGIHAYEGSGYNFATKYAQQYPDKFQHFVNGSATVYPQEGDVMSFTPNHVAIVTSLSVGDPGNGSITLMDQNSDTGGSFSLSIANYEVQSGSGFTPTDWIHPLVGIEMDPSTSLNTQVYGVEGVSSNDLWIAGQEYVTGFSIRSVTWHWDGSTWTKYLPPRIGTNYDSHYLYDVVITSNGDVYTGGNYDCYIGSVTQCTQIFKWNNSLHIWSRATSDNDPSATRNFLSGMAEDSSGNIYAVGYSYKQTTPTYQHPLLLKWDGTKFANQNLPLPSGETYGKLKDISFSSSSNGWIVGDIGTSTNGYYAYHFNGTTWSPVQLPSNVLLEKVKTVSDTEAWAIGYYSSASHIWHYTDANGWLEATVTFPTNGHVYGIDADGADNVWVGGATGIPFYMYYAGAGTNWKQVVAPTLPFNGIVRDINVNDTFVVGAGDRQTTIYSNSVRVPIVQFKVIEH